MKILFFEDDPAVRPRLERQLAGLGYEIAAFAQPSKAAKQLKDAKFRNDLALALLDVKLDVLNQEQLQEEIQDGFSQEKAGFQLADRIKEVKDIPIIFLTAYSEKFEEARKYHPEYFIVKGETTDDTVLMRHIHLAIDRFMERKANQDLRQLQKGKICLNITGPHRKKYVIKIEDILFFEGKDGNTHVYIRGRTREFVLAMNAIDFYRQIEMVLDIKNIENTFQNTMRGKYINLMAIHSFDDEQAYFDDDEKVRCHISTPFYQVLTTKYFPPFKTNIGQEDSA